MGMLIAMGIFIGMVGLLFYSVYVVKKRQKKEFDEMVEREAVERQTNPEAFVKDNDQVWIEYMGMRLPFYRYELPMWKALSVPDKKAWVKKLKDDIRTGKKEIIRERGIVIGYRVKDKKTIRNEDIHKEVYKKVNNL